MIETEAPFPAAVDVLRVGTFDDSLWNCRECGRTLGVVDHDGVLTIKEQRRVIQLYPPFEASKIVQTCRCGHVNRLTS